MRKLFGILASLLIFSSLALAQTMTTVTGTVEDNTGVLATSGTVQFQLTPSSYAINYRIAGTNIIAPTNASCGINSSGQVMSLDLSTSCQVWGNDLITPGNSTYTITYFPDGVQGAVVNQVLISGTNYNLSSPVYAPVVKIVPEYQTITTSPIYVNLIPAANGVFNVGQDGLRYGAGYFNNLFLTNPLPISQGGTGSTTAGSNVPSSLPVPISEGGTGTSTPSLVAGTNTTVSGTWPAQTIDLKSIITTGIWDKAGQVYNIKAYGAAGDATTDDTSAFQSAITAAEAVKGTVLLPPTSSCYLIDSPINLTSSTNQGLGITIEGTSQGAHICANTGGNLFDVSGSDSITFRDLYVTTTGESNPSLVGIFGARNASGAGPAGITVENCEFDMPTHTSGTTYSFGAYLYGSELDRWFDDGFSADYPLVVTSSNSFGLSSTFITIGTGTQSETEDEFYGMELDTSGLGPAAYFDGTQDMVLQGHSWCYNTTTPYPSGLTSYALDFVGDNQSMHVVWRQEQMPGFLETSGSLVSSQIDGTTSPGVATPLHAVEFYGASSEILGDQFSINDQYSSASTNYYYDSNAGSPAGVAVLDGNSFYCGAETNCVSIPIGEYQPGSWTLYAARNTWSGDHSNPTPVVNVGGTNIDGTINGSISIPATAVGAEACTSLSAITDSTVTTQSHILLTNTNWYNLLVSVAPGSGNLTVSLCNPTSGAITPGAGTDYYSVIN